MKDENNHDGTTGDAPMAEMKRLSARAGKLSERGAHYFVGWLIGAGMHKPAMKAEFEKVLTRLEEDPELRHCWRESSNAETPTAVAAASAFVEAESAPAPEPLVATEIQAVSAENLEATLEKSNRTGEAIADRGSQEHEYENEHEHARSRMVMFETTISPQAQERQGFFAKIFRRQRQSIAA